MQHLLAVTRRRRRGPLRVRPRPAGSVGGTCPHARGFDPAPIQLGTKYLGTRVLNLRTILELANYTTLQLHQHSAKMHLMYTIDDKGNR